MHRNVGVGELWKKWEKWDGMRSQERFERDFQKGKTFKYYFQCRRADIPWSNCNRQGGSGQADKAGEI